MTGNITEKKELERSMEEVKRKLQQRNTELDGLIYSAAHDLKTPLVSTVGLFFLLKKTR